MLQGALREYSIVVRQDAEGGWVVSTAEETVSGLTADQAIEAVSAYLQMRLM